MLSVSELNAAMPDDTASSVILARWSCKSAIRAFIISGEGKRSEDLPLAPTSESGQQIVNDRDVLLKLLEVVYETGCGVEKVVCGAVVGCGRLEEGGVHNGQRLVDVFIRLRKREAGKVLAAVVHAGNLLVHGHHEPRLVPFGGRL